MHNPTVWDHFDSTLIWLLWLEGITTADNPVEPQRKLGNHPFKEMSKSIVDAGGEGLFLNVGWYEEIGMVYKAHHADHEYAVRWALTPEGRLFAQSLRRIIDGV